MSFDDRPSVFTPLLRRLFANEGTREERETEELYARVGNAEPYSIDHMLGRLGPYFEDVPGDLLPPIREAIEALIRQEWYFFRMRRPSAMTLAEFVEFRNRLRHKQYFLDNRVQLEQLFHEALVRILCAMGGTLPKTRLPSPFTLPLIYVVPEPGVLITQLFNTVVEDQYEKRLILHGLAEQLARNIYSASNVVPVPGEPPKKPLTYAHDSTLPLDKLTDEYLSGTPFHKLFKTPVPLKFTHEDRFNHMHVVGGTGAGKTQLLQNLILFDLESDDPPALVIVDSQGDLIRNIAHMALFDPECGRLADRLVYITPKDTRYPPALNIFDVNQARLGRYDETTKEQVIAGVIQTFDYLFSGLLGADLTAKQSVFFRFVARLMLALPETMGRNATILDLLNLLDNPEQYRAAVRRLPDIQRNFFERELLDAKHNTFRETKEQIRYRLNAILENPTLARLFTSPETKIDLFNELNKGSIILVDTAKDFLKGASGHFGRIFISLTLQAVLERAALRERDRRPAFLIVDEAAAYFDSNIDDLLTDTRKYKLGCLFAHQYLDQATHALRASLAANTSIKFAARLSTADARAMAPDMRTTANFILGQPRLHFAAHIRDTTPSAVSIPVEVGKLEREPRMRDGAFERMLEQNRRKVSLSDRRAVESAFADPEHVSNKDPQEPVRVSEPARDPTEASTEW